MSSYYSILKFVNNSLTDEFITIGLFMANDDNLYFDTSSAKIEFAKKLNPGSSKLLDFGIKQIKNFVNNEKEKLNLNLLIKEEIKIDRVLLNRLSNYNNGILQFSKALTIQGDLSQQVFDMYYENFVGKEILTPQRKVVSEFKENIISRLYEPLRDKIDVNFTLKKEKLKTLFFDFHFDSLGINGAMYASKSIDLNVEKPIANVRAEISEYESIIERLNIFAENKGLKNEHNYYLIVDPYKGHAVSYNDLYSVLSQNVMPHFRIISSNEIKVVVNQVIENKARKFSEELELI